ncbi:MAG TPA: tetratricopeptide repeat protein [Candidatus Aminicenantes bacterium]|nr:tetratricopeptide repeat protein [Candidatus Aminicenantes bacterium]
MKRNITMRLLTLGLLCLGLTLGLSAQAGLGKGRLNGTVTNEAGQPLAGVKIMLEFEKGGIKLDTLTDKRGAWAFIGLGTGKCNVTADLEGYVPMVEQVELKQLDRNPPLNFILREDKERKMRLQDESSMAILEKGSQLYNERKFEEALAIFSDFAQKNPGVYMIQMNIGDCQRDLGNTDKAMEAYNLALTAAKEKGDVGVQGKALASIGDLYLKKDDLKNAQEYFKQSLAINPQDELLAYNVGEIFFGNGKTTEAIQYYLMAAGIKPTWGAPLMKLGLAYLNRGETDKARDVLTKLVAVEPDSADAATAKAILDTLQKAK